MKFEFIEKNTPGLSWLLEFSPKDDIIKVFHGKYVECCEKGFVAGVWDGNFSNFDFDEAIFPCCSGAKVKDASLVITTPANTLETLFRIEYEGKLYFSNSLAALLVSLNMSLDKNYYRYEYDFCSGLLGLEKDEKWTWLRGGNKVWLYRCCSIIVSADGTVTVEHKSSIKINSYSEYRSLVSNVLKAIADNATDGKRKCKYGMISTISRGYDAPATSALVKEVGCDDVLTFDRPIKYQSDSGVEIAKILNYSNIFAEDADKYLHLESFVEAEACSTGNVSGGEFLAYEKLTSNKLFFMGTRGDSVWDKNHNNVNCNLDFSYGNQLLQGSLVPYEQCLRINCIHINIPFIAAASWPDIHEISNSEEMLGWSVGNDYDRPIPRRILEEKGVPREMFGQKKMGAGSSYHFDTIGRLKYRMSKNGYDSLLAFKHKSHRNPFLLLVNDISFYWKEMPVFVNYLLRKLGIGLRFKESNKNGYKSSSISALIILWGVDEMKNRYSDLKR